MELTLAGAVENNAEALLLHLVAPGHVWWVLGYCCPDIPAPVLIIPYSTWYTGHYWGQLHTHDKNRRLPGQKYVVCVGGNFGLCLSLNLTCWGSSARLWRLQWVSNRDTTVLSQTIIMQDIFRIIACSVELSIIIIWGLCLKLTTWCADVVKLFSVIYANYI